jgi:hypothetical protein
MKKIIYIFSIFSLFLSACIDQTLNRDVLSNQPQVTVSAAVPIGYKQTGLKDIYKTQLQNGKLIEDSSGLLWLKYKQEFDTINAQELIQFPEINKSFQILNNTGNALDLNTLAGTLQFVDTFYIDFSFSNGLGGEELDSIRLENLDFMANISSSFPLNGFLYSNMPDVVYNDKNYNKKLIVNSSNQFSDLKEYSLHLQTIQNKSNLLAVVCTMVLTKSNAIIPANAVMAAIDIRFSNLDYDAIYGYIGQFTFNMPEASTIFDFYNERLSGTFNFEHVSLQLVSDNSFGVPFSFYAHDMNVVGINQQTQQIVFSDALSAQNPALPAYPSLQQEGLSVKDSTSIDISSLKLFTENYATQASAQLSGMCNPSGKTHNNFVLKNSRLLLDLEFDIPFWGYTQQIVIQDTIPFVLKDFYSDNFSSIQRLLFILNSTNAFPMDAAMQIYFCNENCQILDSLSDSPFLIPGGEENQAEERVSARVNETIKKELAKDKILKLENTHFVIIRSKLSTLHVSNNPPLSWKFYSDYFLYTQVGVAAAIENNN